MFSDHKYRFPVIALSGLHTVQILNDDDSENQGAFFCKEKHSNFKTGRSSRDHCTIVLMSYDQTRREEKKWIIIPRISQHKDKRLKVMRV